MEGKFLLVYLTYIINLSEKSSHTINHKGHSADL